jgi:hypothetical protein
VVVAERFVWVHMPKTAGDAASAMFAAVDGLVEFADPADSNDKHLPFFAREDDLTGKLRVMNIRRLPSWVLSAAHHRAAHGLHPEYRPLPLETPEELSCKTDADDLMRWMTDHDRLAVDRWLRAEHLEEDVLGLLDEIGVLNPEAARRVRAVGQVNVGTYDRDLRRWFTPKQVRRLYQRNPRWAELEGQVYGDRLSLN